MLTFLLGWLLARTIRIVPAVDEPFGPGGVPPSPPPPPPGPITPAPAPRRPATSSRRPAPAPAPPVVPASVTTPPWPQVMPSGLPAFPGGWEPYSPPPAAVVRRAAELLPSLWASGAGSFKVEKTGGVWVYYRATPMGSKRGVVAYRERVQSSAPAPSATPTTPAAHVVPASHSVLALPILKLGSRGEEVNIVQRRLNVSRTGTGFFGTQTQAAVIAFQRSKGLKADGIVGTDTWKALFPSGQAA